ncbi:MAG: carboxypeptidase regulatory-like domain-containing protein [Pyrinomonadaceae bacterium]|nr:carboxypeptidase regulatory-like domain-containing protein [Pyrinomonadaceae bacterium]
MIRVYGIKIVPFLLCVLVVPQLFAQRTIELPYSDQKRSTVIAADKRSYGSNDIVDIAGVGFSSFERVRLSASIRDKNLKAPIMLGRWDSYADIEGRISTEWKVVDINTPNTVLTLTARGTISGVETKTDVTILPEAGEALTMEQCANSNATPQNLDCDGSGSEGWVSGNVNASKAKYFEGDSLVYRARMSNLTIGTSYKFTIQYDTSKNGKNALDYLTTYNRTITDANPCRDSGTANDNFYCTEAGPTDTIAIPVDSNVTNGRDTVNGTTDDIVQVPGDITIWDGTFTAISGYTYSGDTPWTGTAVTTLTVTFTADATTAVVAWAGHIASRTDWGQGNAAVDITGSPYHTANGGLENCDDNTTVSGSQDLQLQAAAVIPTGKIIVIKHASPPSPFVFGFSTTNLTPSNFTLVDNDIATDPQIVFDGISTFNTKTIEETNPGSYTLTSINCVVDIGTGGTTVGPRVGNAITVDIQSGDQVTCTFNNDFLTAATVSISGRVFDHNGGGLGRAVVSVTDASGNVLQARTNQFGYYRVEDVEAGGGHIVEVRRKGYNFPTRFLNVNDDMTEIDFNPF